MATDASTPPPAESPAVAFWRARVPPGWTVTGLVAARGSGLVRLRDPGGFTHELEWQPSSGESAAFVRGRALAFGYRPPPNGGDVPVELYRAVLARAASGEDELAVMVAAPPPRPAPRPSRYVTESELWLALARELVAAAGSMPAAVERWLARAAPPGEVGEVLLYFEAPCRQACEFCEEPQHRAELAHRGLQRLVQLRQRTPADLVASGAFEALLHALARREDPPLLTLTGHDWLEHPRLDDLLAALERARGLRLRCYGPSTRLADPALAARVARLPGLEWVGLTLQSCDPAVHDAVVGAPGAGLRVQRAIETLLRLGAPLDVTLVLSRATLPTLSRTVHWAFERGAKIGLQAVIPDRALRNAGPLLPRADEVARALEAIAPEARAAVRWIVGAPVCAVPPALRELLQPPPAARSREALSHPGPCGSCAGRARCAGVPASYLATFGTQGLVPLRGAAGP